MLKIAFCTGNKSKVISLQQQLNGLAKVFQVDLGLDEIQGSIERVCEQKLLTAFAFLTEDGCNEDFDAIVCEDGGLELEAFCGNPGPYTKDFLDGLNPEAREHMLKVIVHTACHFKKPKAVFKNCLGFLPLEGGGKPEYFVDKAEGYVLEFISLPTASALNRAAHRIIALNGFEKPMCQLTPNEWADYRSVNFLRYSCLRTALQDLNDRLGPS